jgi:lipid-binding SYLF domain-containing protein
VTLVLLSGMAAAQLNSSTRLVAQVPFEFMVANKIVPAGECEVQAFTMDGQTLVIRNAEAKVGLFSRSSQAEGKQNASNYAMVFKHYGDRYFLSGIKLQGSKITYRLPESKVEAELRAQNVSATEETLRASLK